MTFSIIIPTFNRLVLLQRAVESALAQTWPCEVIIVDDCSSDGTEQYVTCLLQGSGERQTSRHPIVYHRNSENRGHAAAMNRGVELAQGDWIKLLDDDNWLAPTCIEEIARCLRLHPSAVICSCRAALLDAKGTVISYTTKTGPGRAFYVDQADIHYGMLLEVMPFGTPVQVAFSRDAFLKTGGFDSSLDLVCDEVDCWIKIAKFGDAIFINECLAYRTVWSGSYNRRVPINKRLQNNLLVKTKIYELISAKHRPYLPALLQIHRYLRLHWFIVSLKQRDAKAAMRGFPAALEAWRLLIQALLFRFGVRWTARIRRHVLIES